MENAINAHIESSFKGENHRLALLQIFAQQETGRESFDRLPQLKSTPLKACQPGVEA